MGHVGAMKKVRRETFLCILRGIEPRGSIWGSMAHCGESIPKKLVLFFHTTKQVETLVAVEEGA